MEDKIFDDAFFKKLNTLKLSMRMRLTQGMSGGRKSTAKGTSVEFSDFREYILGDDIRRIDWNAYGRFDKLYIKQFMEEKEGLYNIFLDVSKSMDYGTSGKAKTALQLTGALAYLVLNNLDRVYVTEVKENSLSEGRGLSGKNAFKNILFTLQNIRFDGRTTLSASISKRQLNGRGTSIIISDFMDPAGLDESLRYLKYKKQHIVLIQVLSKEELSPSGEGALNLIDSETGDRVRVTMNRELIASYENVIAEYRQQLKKLAKKYEADYLFATAGQSVDEILLNGAQAGGLVTAK